MTTINIPVYERLIAHIQAFNRSIVVHWLNHKVSPKEVMILALWLGTTLDGDRIYDACVAKYPGIDQ